jgi:hypothetical protein
VLFGLKLPEVLVGLAVAGIAGALVAVARSTVSPGRRAALLVIALAAAVPVLMAVATRPAMYNGIRHFIFVVPPLAIMGGLAASWLVEQFARASRMAAYGVAFVLLGGLALPVIEMVRLHPYQYTHFNWIAGGIRSADERYMLDYWGLAFKQASQELRTRLAERLETPANTRRWRIAVCGPHPAAAVELGPEFVTTWDAKGADFALMLGEFYCAKLNAPVLVEIEREGVVFARVYDVRGRTISNLFTVPPVERDEERK